MAKHLRGRDVDRIVGLLDGWNGRLTWELLSKGCPQILGNIPARQTLHRFERVREASRPQSNDSRANL
jgi:hypothetical protein